jgi:hypothetical protein
MTSNAALKSKSRPKRATAGAARKRRRAADAALERRLRPVVRKLLDEMLEDRMDYVESQASLADGVPISADEVWKRLGI